MVRLSGRAATGAPVVLLADVRPFGALRPVARTTADAAGRFRFAIRLRRATRYRVVVAGVRSGTVRVGVAAARRNR